MMRSKLMMSMRKTLDKARHFRKLTVFGVQDEEDFGIQDEVPQDSEEQIEAKQNPCDECD